MLSELQLYYEDKQRSILPFVAAPMQQQQDSLIVAPKSIAKIHDDFIDQIYNTVPNTTLDFVYVRAFDFNSKIVITTMFPSTVTEEKTHRHGLVLTLGVLIKKHIFKEYDFPSSTFIDLFISLFPNFFDVDLYSDGASIIIKNLRYKEYYPELKKHFSSILEVLLKCTFNMRKARRFQFSFFKRGGEDLSSLPQIILYNHALDAELLIHIFLKEIDQTLRHGDQSDLDISSYSLNGERAITLINSDFLPNNMSKAELKKIRKGKYIYIY